MEDFIMSKISELTTLTTVDRDNDYLPIVDASDSTTKKVTPGKLSGLPMQLIQDKTATKTEFIIPESKNFSSVILFTASNPYSDEGCVYLINSWATGNCSVIPIYSKNVTATASRISDSEIKVTITKTINEVTAIRILD